MIIFLVTIVVIAFPYIAREMQPELTGSIYTTFGTDKFWVMLVTGPLICVTGDTTIKVARRIFVPSPSDQIQSKEKRLLAVERGMQILKFRQILSQMARNFKEQVFEEREMFKTEEESLDGEGPVQKAGDVPNKRANKPKRINKRKDKKNQLRTKEEDLDDDEKEDLSEEDSIPRQSFVSMKKTLVSKFGTRMVTKKS